MLEDDIRAVVASQKAQTKAVGDMVAMAKAAGEGPLVQILRDVDFKSKAVANRAAEAMALGVGPLTQSLRIMEDAREAALAAGRMPNLPVLGDLNRTVRELAEAGMLPSSFSIAGGVNGMVASLGSIASLAASTGSVQGYLSRITSQYSAFLDSALFRSLDWWRESLELATEFALVMSQLGWPPPRDLPPQLMRRIVDAFQQYDEEVEADELQRFALSVEGKVLEYYPEESVRGMLEDWRGRHLLARRFHILEAAIDAHCRGGYWLSVPVLLAQTEGIVADGFNHKGRMNASQYGAYRAELFEVGDDELTPAAVNDALVEFCASVVYVAFAHGEPLSSTLSRHAILHGGDVAYGTAANSLKLLLLIDSLQDNFKLTVLEGSDVYHNDDCLALVHSTARGRSYKTLDAVLVDGKRPCKRCCPPC